MGPVRRFSRDVQGSVGPVMVCRSQRVQSGSEGARGSSQGLRESEGPVRV